MSAVTSFFLPTGVQNVLISSMLCYILDSVVFGEVVYIYSCHETVERWLFFGNTFWEMYPTVFYYPVQFRASIHPPWAVLKQPKSPLLKNEWGFSHHDWVIPSILIPSCHVSVWTLPYDKLNKKWFLDQVLHFYLILQIICLWWVFSHLRFTCLHICSFS